MGCKVITKVKDEFNCLMLKDYALQGDYQGEDEVQTTEPSWVAVLIKVFPLMGIIFPPFCSTTSSKS